MVTLKEYISDGLKKGYSKEELEKILVEKGYSKKEIEQLFDSPIIEKEEDTQEELIELNIFQKVGCLVSNPNYFFKNVKEKNIWNSIGLATLSLIIPGIIFGLMSFAFVGGNIFMNLGNNIVPFIFGTIVAWLFGIFIASFCLAGIYHLFLKIFQGKGGFVNTFNVMMYSIVPSIILSVIPVVNFLVPIYSLVLTCIGFAKQHDISIGRAIGSVLITIGLIVGLFIGFIIWALSAAW